MCVGGHRGRGFEIEGVLVVAQGLFGSRHGCEQDARVHEQGGVLGGVYAEPTMVAGHHDTRATD